MLSDGCLPVCLSVRLSVTLVYCGQTVGWIKMKLGMQVGLTVLEPSSASPKRVGDHQISAHICYGQMGGWIKMKLGMQVGLGPGHIVLDGHPALSHAPRGTVPPNFRPISVAAKWLNGVRRHFVWR